MSWDGGRAALGPLAVELRLCLAGWQEGPVPLAAPGMGWTVGDTEALVGRMGPGARTGGERPGAARNQGTPGVVGVVLGLYLGGCGSGSQASWAELPARGCGCCAHGGV